MEKCLERLKLYLSENGVAYEVQHHRDVFTSQKLAAELHEKGRHIGKVFMAWADGKFIMLVLPATRKVDLELARAALGANYVRLAREEEFRHLFADCDLGAMPPFGNLYGLPVYLDRSLTDMPYLVFEAGTHREAMRISMPDYVRLAAPVVREFTLQTEPA